MDYKTLFFSVCEIAGRLDEKYGWGEENIDISFNESSYNTFTKKYILVVPSYDRITLDLSEFGYLKYLMVVYQDMDDKEMYLVKCIHSVIISQLIEIFPIILEEYVTLFYRVNENIYPLAVTKKNIIK